MSLSSYLFTRKGTQAFHRLSPMILEIALIDDEDNRAVIGRLFTHGIEKVTLNLVYLRLETKPL